MKPTAPSPPAPAPTAAAAADAALVRRHLRFGLWSLFVLLLVGLVLEGLHGLKAGWYLETGHATRRHLLTLGHAHGTLLALLNLAFAAVLPRLAGFTPRGRTLASRALIASTVLLPAGFLLGGAFAWEGDPGLGVVLVPVGALLLALSVGLAARAVR